MKRILFLLLFVITSVTLWASVTITGRVYDAYSNEGISFATIQVFESDLGVITDIDGTYRLDDLPPGEYRLKISYVGYKPIITEAEYIRFGSKVIDIPMEKSSQELEEFTVEANPFKGIEESPLAFKRISSAEIDMNPGANRDISKVVQSFPGVAGSTAFRNDLIVRGGGPAENTYYLEGIEIPNLNHFATQGASGGPVGIINADLIREVGFLSGAFPASKGDALSSVLDFKMIDGGDERKYKLALGASEVSLETEGKIGKKSNYIASARRSYLQFLFAGLGLPFLPTFNDLTFKVETKLSPKNDLTILGIGAYDKNVLNLDAPDNDGNRFTLSTVPYQTQWNYTLGAVYKHYFEESYLNVVVSNNHLRNTLYKYLDNQNDDPNSKILDYTSDEDEFKTRVEHVMRKGNIKWVSGAGMEVVNYGNRTMRKAFIGGNAQVFDYDTDLGFVKYNVFEQATYTSTNNFLSVSVGARLDGNTYSDEMKNPLKQFSPRVAMSLALMDNLKFNMNTGRFYQLPAYTTLGYQLNGRLVNKDNEISPISSTQYGLGFEYLPLSYLVLTMEGFYKGYNKYPMSLTDSVSLASKGGGYELFGDEEVASVSDGRAYGVEFMARWAGHAGYNFVLAYTWVNSEFTDLRTSSYQPSAWDNKHLVSFTGTKMLKKDWTIGMKFRMQGGSPYTPIDEGKSALKQAWDARGVAYYDYDRFNSERLETFTQLDLRVDKNFYFSDKWMLGVYFDVQNVLGRTYQGASVYIQDTDENGAAMIENPNAPLAEQRYKMKYINQSSGTVLPTLGIMIEF